MALKAGVCYASAMAATPGSVSVGLAAERPMSRYFGHTRRQRTSMPSSFFPPPQAPPPHDLRLPNQEPRVPGHRHTLRLLVLSLPTLRSQRATWVCLLNLRGLLPCLALLRVPVAWKRGGITAFSYARRLAGSFGLKMSPHTE